MGNLFIFVMLLGLFGLFIYLIIADSDKSRMGKLSVNGKTIKDSSIVVAKCWTNRRVGLLNHTSLSPLDGLLILTTNRVHTRGMLFDIDIVYLDDHGKILAIQHSVKPDQILDKGPDDTAEILELAAGAAKKQFSLKIGDEIKVVT